MSTTYDVHKIAKFYPKLTGKEYSTLRASIKRDGLLNPITLFEGQILDGSNRYRACLDEGVTPTFRDLPEGVSPIDYVIDQNETRRHLTNEQRVFIAARMVNVGRGGNRKAPVAGNTVAKVAEKMRVSKTGVKRAQAVLKKGSPKVIEAAETSEVTVHEAEQISHLPEHADQDKVIAAMKADKAAAKAGREALKQAKKSGLKFPKPVVSDLDKKWKEFLPSFKSLLRLFKTFKSIDEHTVIRSRIYAALDEAGLGDK